jgi:hypothetical protein
MARWPDVPAVYGWLALDRRGHWLLKGERISNPLVAAFIGRNYEREADGRWFFQNGPQRVYVDLDYTPFVYRVADLGTLAVEDQTGATGLPSAAFLDEEGALVLDTGRGPGIVHDADLYALVGALVDEQSASPLREDELERRLGPDGGPTGLALRNAEGRLTVVRRLSSAAAPRHFGYVARPSALAGTTP